IPCQLSTACQRRKPEAHKILKQEVRLTVDRLLARVLCHTKPFAEVGPMDPVQASRNLELIRTLMERTTQYQLLTARAGLAAGCMAGLGALSFLVLEPSNPWHFGAVWGVVFAGSLTATLIGTVLRGRDRGERVWSRPARAVLRALTPSLFAALAMTIFFFARGG